MNSRPEMPTASLTTLVNRTEINMTTNWAVTRRPQTKDLRCAGNHSPKLRSH